MKTEPIEDARVAFKIHPNIKHSLLRQNGEPFDCVRELVSNSIDAGATAIWVQLDDFNDGHALQVQDNGCGMTANDIKKLAFRMFSSRSDRSDCLNDQVGTFGIGLFSTLAMPGVEALVLATRASSTGGEMWNAYLDPNTLKYRIDRCEESAGKIRIPLSARSGQQPKDISVFAPPDGGGTTVCVVYRSKQMKVLQCSQMMEVLLFHFRFLSRDIQLYGVQLIPSPHPGGMLPHAVRINACRPMHFIPRQGLWRKTTIASKIAYTAWIDAEPSVGADNRGLYVLTGKQVVLAKYTEFAFLREAAEVSFILDRCTVLITIASKGVVDYPISRQRVFETDRFQELMTKIFWDHIVRFAVENLHAIGPRGFGSDRSSGATDFMHFLQSLIGYMKACERIGRLVFPDKRTKQLVHQALFKRQVFQLYDGERYPWASLEEEARRSGGELRYFNNRALLEEVQRQRMERRPPEGIEFILTTIGNNSLLGYYKHCFDMKEVRTDYRFHPPVEDDDWMHTAFDEMIKLGDFDRENGLVPVLTRFHQWTGKALGHPPLYKDKAQKVCRINTNSPIIRKIAETARTGDAYLAGHLFTQAVRARRVRRRPAADASRGRRREASRQPEGERGAMSSESTTGVMGPIKGEVRIDPLCFQKLVRAISEGPAFVREVIQNALDASPDEPPSVTLWDNTLVSPQPRRDEQRIGTRDIEAALRGLHEPDAEFDAFLTQFAALSQSLDEHKDMPNESKLAPTGDKPQLPRDERHDAPFLQLLDLLNEAKGGVGVVRITIGPQGGEHRLIRGSGARHGSEHGDVAKASESSVGSENAADSPADDTPGGRSTQGASQPSPGTPAVQAPKTDCAILEVENARGMKPKELAALTKIGYSTKTDKPDLRGEFGTGFVLTLSPHIGPKSVEVLTSCEGRQWLLRLWYENDDYKSAPLKTLTCLDTAPTETTRVTVRFTKERRRVRQFLERVASTASQRINVRVNGVDLEPSKPLSEREQGDLDYYTKTEDGNEFFVHSAKPSFEIPFDYITLNVRDLPVTHRQSSRHFLTGHKGVDHMPQNERGTVYLDSSDTQINAHTVSLNSSRDAIFRGDCAFDALKEQFDVAAKGKLLKKADAWSDENASDLPRDSFTLMLMGRGRVSEQDLYRHQDLANVYTLSTRIRETLQRRAAGEAWEDIEGSYATVIRHLATRKLFASADGKGEPTLSLDDIRRLSHGCVLYDDEITDESRETLVRKLLVHPDHPIVRNETLFFMGHHVPAVSNIADGAMPDRVYSLTAVLTDWKVRQELVKKGVMRALPKRCRSEIDWAELDDPQRALLRTTEGLLNDVLTTFRPSHLNPLHAKVGMGRAGTPEEEKLIGLTESTVTPDGRLHMLLGVDHEVVEGALEVDEHRASYYILSIAIFEMCHVTREYVQFTDFLGGHGMKMTPDLLEEELSGILLNVCNDIGADDES